MNRLSLSLASCLVALAVPVSAQDVPNRYLTGTSVDLIPFLPAPPARGSTLERRDKAMFRHGRPAVGSDRWRMATADVDESVPSMLRDFSDATGIILTPQTHPVLAKLLLKMRPDVAAAVNAVKPRYARPRPFLLVKGPVCESKIDLAKSFDYPSGHTSWGTSVALVLAELLPSRADAILARGHDYGESRVVCGAHSVSAVDAGRQAAAAIIAVLHGSGQFRNDLEAARRELAGTRDS